MKKSSTFFLFLFRQNTRESQYFVYRVQNPVKRDVIGKIFHWIIAGKHDILTDSAVISHSKSNICERLQHKIKNKEDPNGRF